MVFGQISHVSLDRYNS